MKEKKTKEKKGRSPKMHKSKNSRPPKIKR